MSSSVYFTLKCRECDSELQTWPGEGKGAVLTVKPCAKCKNRIQEEAVLSHPSLDTMAAIAGRIRHFFLARRMKVPEAVIIDREDGLRLLYELTKTDYIMGRDLHNFSQQVVRADGQDWHQLEYMGIKFRWKAHLLAIRGGRIERFA